MYRRLILEKKRIKGRTGDEIISARFDEVNIYQSTGLFDEAKQELFDGDWVSGRNIESLTKIVGKIEYRGGEYVVVDDEAHI